MRLAGGRLLVAGAALAAVAACSGSGTTTTSPAPATTTAPPATTTTVTAPTTTPVAPLPAITPSQAPADARRDGVVPELAAVALDLRAEALVEVPVPGGSWALTRATPELDALATGCPLGDTSGEYGVDSICTAEYGEILLLDEDRRIVRAYPMPGAPPSWIHVADGAVYAGHVGDGALPDTTAVRIDRATGEPVVWVIRAPFDGAESWPPSWRVASDERAAGYASLVGFAPEVAGTAAASWIGEVLVDVPGLEEWFAAG